jgi:hypothetical protein
VDAVKSWREIPRLLGELRRLPRVTITMSGGAEAERLYRSFTRRHPRYWVVPNKSWGVGLLKLPAEFSEYARGREMQAVRTNRSKAVASGFHVEKVHAVEYAADIYDVNVSMSERQGRVMEDAFLDRARVRAYCEQSGDVYGVLNGDGRLRGYTQVIVAGEVALLNRLLGHGDDLDKGIMYLCLTEVVRAMCEAKRDSGLPLWLMYDTFFGAEPGLRYFKERLGFKPYKVSWAWAPELRD